MDILQCQNIESLPVTEDFKTFFSHSLYSKRKINFELHLAKIDGYS